MRKSIQESIAKLWETVERTNQFLKTTKKSFGDR